MTTKAYVPALLGLPPTYIFAGDGDFRENRLSWLQPAQFWTAIYYHHPNVVTINARTFPVPPESICLFQPSCRAGHAIIGEPTPHMFITFNLPAESGKRYAVKNLVNPATDFFAGFRNGCDHVSSDILPAASFIWNYLARIAENPVVLRQNEALYTAEDFILRNLKTPLRIPDVAENSGVSARQLLRMFRQEHRMTVQEFIRAKRAQEACRLLSTTDRPIKNIAAEIGLPDLAQFNKLIKSETGAPPSKYRFMANERS